MGREDLQHLLHGGTLRFKAGRDDVEVCLADIGFERMQQTLDWVAGPEATLPPVGEVRLVKWAPTDTAEPTDPD
jgi:hypothetical protein